MNVSLYHEEFLPATYPRRMDGQDNAQGGLEEGDHEVVGHEVVGREVVDLLEALGLALLACPVCG